MGPMMDPSTLVREKARDSWVRVQSNWPSSTMNQTDMPWNNGTVPMAMMKADIPTSTQP